MDAIYTMGYDVWGDNQPEETYLKGCRASQKYKQGQWYYLEHNNTVVSSLIVYTDCFGLQTNFAGIGSIATRPDARRKGFASALLENRLKFLADGGIEGVFIFSDIDTAFYQKHGFEKAATHGANENSTAMFTSFNGCDQPEVPSYF